MRVRGLINRRSGTCIDQEVETIRDGLVEAFRARGHDCAIDCVTPEGVAAALKRIVAETPGILVAGGGDGTIRSAAVAVLGKPIALAPIPLGTMNRFARDLRIPLDPVAAAEALANGEFGMADVAEVNGQIFLCNSMLGLPPEFSMQRGALRGKDLLERVRGYFKLVKEFVSSTHKITVSLDDGRSQRSVRALSIIVSNNLYGEDVSPMVLRSSLSDGVLGIYISRHQSGAGMAMAFLRAMLGRWKSDPSLEFTKARRLTLGTHGRRVQVSNDGEVDMMSSPLEYRIRPQALTVLRPSGEKSHIVKPATSETSGAEASRKDRDGVERAAPMNSLSA